MDLLLARSTQNSRGASQNEAPCSFWALDLRAEFGLRRGFAYSLGSIYPTTGRLQSLQHSRIALMHRFQRDPHTGVFTAFLDGETTSADLAQAVTACLDGAQAELKAVWIVHKMSVSFTSDEIAQLMQSVSKLPIPPGRIAFVTGTSAFLKSLTDLSEDLRPNKRLKWRSFPTTDEAIEWATGRHAQP